MFSSFVIQSSLVVTLALSTGCGVAQEVADDLPRALTMVREEGGRPMIRRAVVGIAAACVLMSGCAYFMETPGTPLAKAAHAGNITEIRRLIAAGANPNEYDASNQTPLHWAARGGHNPGPHRCSGEAVQRPDVISVLIDLGADVNAVDRRGNVPGGSSGWTPLHVALHHEQFNTAAKLLERGANPTIRSTQGTTVMAMAANEGAPKQLLATILARTPR